MMVISGNRWPSEGTHQWQSDLVQKEELGRGRIAGRRPSILVTFQSRQGERPKELLWGPRRRGERMHAGRAVQRVPQGSKRFHSVPQEGFLVRRVISGHQRSSAYLRGREARQRAFEELKLGGGREAPTQLRLGGA